MGWRGRGLRRARYRDHFTFLVEASANTDVRRPRYDPDARAALTELGYEVLGPQIPRPEVYALAYGAEPDIRGGDPFDLLAETYLKRAGLL